MPRPNPLWSRYFFAMDRDPQNYFLYIWFNLILIEMDSYEFMKLDHKQQLRELIVKGEMIMKVDNGDSYFVLYALGRMFIEVEHEKFTDRFISLAPFTSGKRLDKYVGDLGLLDS